MKKKFDVYLKKLTTQELGYRKGRLMTGGYFYVSKSAVGTFFKELNKKVLNDHLKLEFNDPLEPNNMIHATYVYHNDKYCVPNGTRDEYRIYHNRHIAKHELHFQPHEIVAFIKIQNDIYRIEHYTPRDEQYILLLKAINKSELRGNHALLHRESYDKILIGT